MADSVIEIRSARADEMPIVAAVLARAFADDPVTRGMLGGAKNQEPLFSAWMERLLPQHHLRRGAVDVAVEDGTVVGAAAWLAPGELDLSVRERARIYGPLVPVLGWRIGTIFLQEVRDARTHPSAPHWYLHFMGVSAPGKGIGGMLLDHGIDRASQMPCYLEATTPGSVRLYARKGFVDIGTSPAAGGAEAQVRMWRSAG